MGKNHLILDTALVSGLSCSKCIVKYRVNKVHYKTSRAAFCVNLDPFGSVIE